MKLSILLVAGLFFGNSTFSQNTPTLIKAMQNGEITVNGSLEKGIKIGDLSWAWNSSVACFPATQQNSFNGNHVLYETALPKKSILEITVTPKNPLAKMSIYGYSVGTNSKYVVPNLPSCVSCEADNNQMGKAVNNTRSIKLNAINNPYKVYFAVVGENGLQKGDYTITIKLTGGVKPLQEQRAAVVKSCKAPEKGSSLSYKDDLKNGVVIHDLSWAWNSSVACFPETQKLSFTGKHKIFETFIPKYSEMTITLIPTSRSAKMSLYGYQVGMNSTYVVPNLPSCVSCEADNNQMGKATNNHRSIKFMAINHPYKIMIGVAGVKGLAEGEFIIQISVKGR